MLSRVFSWFRTTTFDGKIIKEIGTVFGSGGVTGKSSIDIQVFKKRSSAIHERYVRLNVDSIGFAGLGQNQIILDASEAWNLIRFVEEAVSN